MTISNETKIGALTAVAITILILGYSFLRGDDIFSGSNKFYAVYSSVDGLSVSKPVLVNGYQIGRVSKMKLQADGRTIVEFKIEEQYKVPSNTLAKLASTDLLGGKAIVFKYGNSNTYAADKDTLRADVEGSLAESLQPIQMKAQNLITRLDSMLSSINKILNPNFRKNVDRGFFSIANSLETLEGTTKKIDALIGSQTAHIDAIMANTETVSSNLKVSTAHLTNISANFEKGKWRYCPQFKTLNIRLKMLIKPWPICRRLLLILIQIKARFWDYWLNDDKMYKNLERCICQFKKKKTACLLILGASENHASFSVFGKKEKRITVIFVWEPELSRLWMAIKIKIHLHINLPSQIIPPQLRMFFLQWQGLYLGKHFLLRPAGRLRFCTWQKNDRSTAFWHVFLIRPRRPAMLLCDEFHWPYQAYHAKTLLRDITV